MRIANYLKKEEIRNPPKHRINNNKRKRNNSSIHFKEIPLGNRSGEILFLLVIIFDLFALLFE